MRWASWCEGGKCRSQLSLKDHCVVWGGGGGGKGGVDGGGGEGVSGKAGERRQTDVMKMNCRARAQLSVCNFAALSLSAPPVCFPITCEFALWPPG